jgi:amino acid adenylation domain-containing protein
LLVDHFLTDSASQFPERVALVCGNRRLTYRQVDQAASRLAAGLRRLGVRRGDRVAICLDNSAEAAISIFGILRAGAAFVTVGPTVKFDKLAYILSDSEASALIVDQRATQLAADAVAQSLSVKTILVVGDSGDSLSQKTARVVISFESILETEPTEKPSSERGGIDLDLAALVYTSGSTAHPKGVMLTHLNIVAAATSIGDYLGNTSEDVILNVLPLSFDYGLYQIFLAFKVGARLVLERSFIYTAVVLDRLVQEGVTGLPIVPMLAVLLVKHDLSAYQTKLRYITNTGAALPPAHIAILRQRFPQVRIFSMYGLTECKRVSFLPPEEIDARPTSVGKPMDNVEVFVADNGTLHKAGIGELVIRGSNVMQGYWRAPEETARVLKPGPLPGQHLLYSGDLFRIDEDGYMYFQSRLDDVIKSRGQRVSPKEVENVIHEMQGVVAVSVVGVPDETQGSFIKAFVHLDEGVTLSERDVLRHCAQRLEDFMVPKVVEFVRFAPTTDSGKLHKRLMASQDRRATL